MDHPRLDVLRAMRHKRNETQLTRAITALGKHDQRLAAQMARAIVATAAEHGNRASADLLGRIPESLTIINEPSLGPVRIGRRKASGGRLDWQMATDEFSLVVEVKIGAAVAMRQLERYLASFSSSEVVGGLVLLTPATAEIPVKVERHDRWLGQIRWDELIPRLPAITPADPVVDEEWKLLLAVIAEPGDLADEPVGWQLGPHKVGARNRLVLSAVRDRATSTVAVELARRAGRSTSDGLCGVNPKSRARSVVVSGDRAKLALFVPTATKRGAVIEVDLAGTRRPLKLTTYVNPGLPPLVRRRADYDKTLTKLCQGGFAKQVGGTHEGWYAAHDAIAPTDDTATPQEALWTVLEGRLKAIAASGTLDPLVS
jgi:RecB family endonuclease NucS